MNIEEILEALKPQDEEFIKAEIKEYPLYLSRKQQDLLLDYITNLQEEIERQSKAQVILDNQITEMYDYKLRCEKAIELIKEAGCYDEETKTFCDDIWEELPKLLNILNGGDDNE